MKALTTSTNYLLELGFDVIHQEHELWYSRFDFWKDEVAFFQKLLHQYEKKANTEVEIATHETMTEKLAPLHRKIHQLHNRLIEHENELSEILQNKKKSDDHTVVEMHQKMKTEVLHFEKNFREYKKQLYQFIGRFIQVDKIPSLE